MGPYDPIVGLACAPIVETIFLELVMSLLGFSPRIPLGTFSILHYVGYNFLHGKQFMDTVRYYCVQNVVFLYITLNVWNRSKPEPR